MVTLDGLAAQSGLTASDRGLVIPDYERERLVPPKAVMRLRGRASTPLMTATGWKGEGRQ